MFRFTLPQMLRSLSPISGCWTLGAVHPQLYLHYLVDLNMDEAAESSETSPRRLVDLNPSSREVVRLRRKTLTEGNHIVVELNIGGGSVIDKWGDMGKPLITREFR